MSYYQPLTTANPYAAAYDPNNAMAQLNSLTQSAPSQRDTALQALMAQYYGPSMANAYAATPVDMLAQQYESQKRGLLSGAAARGTLNTGGTRGAMRGLQGAYGGGVLGAEQQAGAQETSRKQGLNQQIMSIAAADLADTQNLASGTLAQKSAYSAESLAGLSSILNMAAGSANIVAEIVKAYFTGGASLMGIENRSGALGGGGGGGGGGGSPFGGGGGNPYWGGGNPYGGGFTSRGAGTAPGYMQQGGGGFSTTGYPGS